MENQSLPPQRDLFFEQRPLPNATAVLVLGILSIVLCFICGIVALIISSGDKRLYNNSPEAYTSSSYDLLRAGRICSIIGLSIWGFILFFYIAIIIFAFSFASFK